MSQDPKHIRIAVDVRDLQIAASGTRTFLKELICEFEKASAQFTFFYLDSPSKVYTGNNIFGKIWEQFKFFYWKQVQLPLKAKRLKCDIVFCSDFMVPWFQPGFKTIPVFHDAFFWEYPQHYNRWWLKLFRGLTLAAAQKSPFIVTPTYYTQAKISEYTGLPLEKLIPIGEGPKAHAAIAPVTLPAKAYLLHVGTLEKRKNIPTLIKAFKQLRDQGQDIELVLVGKASNKPSLDDSQHILQYIQELNLNEHIQLKGYLPDEQVAAFYQNALAYVFPSFNEGFGIPVLEAFYYETPLIVANNSCLPEVAGDAALSFDPYDADVLARSILSIIHDPSLREQLIEKGKTRLQKYTWSKTAKQLLDIFAQVNG